MPPQCEYEHFRACTAQYLFFLLLSKKSFWVCDLCPWIAHPPPVTSNLNILVLVEVNYLTDKSGKEANSENGRRYNNK